MANEQSQDPSGATPVAADNINNQIKSILSASSDQVAEAVVKKLTEIEIENRVSIIITTLNKRDELLSNLKKIKPDSKVLNADGTIIHEGYSPKVIEEKNKLEKDFKEITEAIESALTSSNYDKIKKFSK